MASGRKKPAAGDDDVTGMPPFEEALGRLETIVEELEGGELTLEDSIARYEEGMKLSRGLARTLDQAEKRIEKLVEGGAGEDPVTRPMDEDFDDEPGGTGQLPF
jgi:exodeoxyribonuclease VII small subunit